MEDQIRKQKEFEYVFPSLSLLDPEKASVIINDAEIEAGKNKIKEVFNELKIPVTGIEAFRGSSATLYEVTPHESVKMSKIKNMADDISLCLAPSGIRIIAPIPGKETIGIEVGNEKKEAVLIHDLLQSEEFKNQKLDLPIALGKTYLNKPNIADLAKMPHLLIGGATGLDNSILLNDIIISLLYSKRPDELKFVLFDPSMVEFSQYEDIENQYLAKSPEVEDPVVTDINDMVTTLEALCIEMDNRFHTLHDTKTRNIKEYNKKVENSELDFSEYKTMPYIVLVIHDWDDLILTAGKEVEFPIARIAQKGRAVGIHIIIATRKPSTNVITGIIKANFPARIAFKVSSAIDSKTILDEKGAENLGPCGDCLIYNSAPLVRAQAALADMDEISLVCEHISKQPAPQYPYYLPITGRDEKIIEEPKDPLFKECVEFMVDTNIVSVSALQRKFKIGYNRANKIMKQLEVAGIVSPPTRFLKMKKEDLNNLEL